MIGVTGQLGLGALGAFELGAVTSSQVFVPHRRRIRAVISARIIRATISASRVRAEVT
jgi:hypothetical protein